MVYHPLKSDTMKVLTRQEQQALGGTHEYIPESWRKPIILETNQLGYRLLNTLRSSVGDEGKVHLDYVGMILGEGSFFLKLSPLDKKSLQAEDPVVVEQKRDEEGNTTWHLREDLTIRLYAMQEHVGFSLHPKEGSWIAQGVEAFRNQQNPEGSVTKLDRR